MTASALIFRLRMAVQAIIITLGFWAPWIEYAHIGRRISTLEWLALMLARAGLVPFGVATPAVIVAASVIAALAVVLRVWGTAYMGATVVNHPEMQAGGVKADGPYRYVRNPLYLGVWCMVTAMTIFMPPTGALFAIVLTTAHMLALTLGEEKFLAARMGEPYRAYSARVPRLIPRFRGAPPRSGEAPQWLRAVLVELLPIGVLIAVAGISWSYQSSFAMRFILISFGVSLVVRAVLPARLSAPAAE